MDSKQKDFTPFTAETVFSCTDQRHADITLGTLGPGNRSSQLEPYALHASTEPRSWRPQAQAETEIEPRPRPTKNLGSLTLTSLSHWQ
eukprot:2324461-Rhodomonas_salina.1